MNMLKTYISPYKVEMIHVIYNLRLYDSLMFQLGNVTTGKMLAMRYFYLCLNYE